MKSEVWFFRGTDFAPIGEALKERGKSAVFDTYDIVDFPDEYSSGVFLFIEGGGQIFKLMEDGSEFVIGTIGRGDIFGKRTLFEEISQNSFVKATNPSKVLAVSIGFFMKELSEFKEKKRATPYGVELMLRDLLFKDVNSKVSDLLWKVSTEARIKEIKVKFDQMAAILGTCTDSLILTLAGFKNKGFIQIDGRKITILKPEEMKKSVE